MSAHQPRRLGAASPGQPTRRPDGDLSGQS